MQHLINRANIESNKVFQRMIDKTQVTAQNLGRQEVVKTRLTHSYEVATSALIIAETISSKAFNADYQNSIYNVCLLHDIGHPPFGHEGAKLINKRFKNLGLEEGFSDNNNNFTIIKKNQIKISDYELASLIKYPEKLYANQECLKNFLQKSINEDIAYFSQFITINQRPERTLACEVMDEADRNTYVCDDLTDCYSRAILKSDELKELLDSNRFFNTDILEFLNTAIKAVDDKNKTLIKNIFSDLKIKFNTNYYLGENLKLCFKDQELFEFREVLNKLSVQKYIFSDIVQKIKDKQIEKLDFYIDYVFENDYFPSNYYASKIQQSTTELERLTLIRDMISECSDMFITKSYKDLRK